MVSMQCVGVITIAPTCDGSLRISPERGGYQENDDDEREKWWVSFVSSCFCVSTHARVGVLDDLSEKGKVGWFGLVLFLTNDMFIMHQIRSYSVFPYPKTGASTKMTYAGLFFC